MVVYYNRTPWEVVTSERWGVFRQVDPKGPTAERVNRLPRCGSAATVQIRRVLERHVRDRRTCEGSKRSGRGALKDAPEDVAVL